MKIRERRGVTEVYEKYEQWWVVKKQEVVSNRSALGGRR